MFPSQSVFSGFSAGYSPTEFSGFITKAKGRVIEEIDGEPASNLYKEWVEIIQEFSLGMSTFLTM